MSTYFELSNELLRRLNEVEMTSTTFASAQGLQATAKDCIRASVSEINAKEKEWSFNFLGGSQLLTPGTEEYTLPTLCDSADWESFRIQKDDSLATQTHPLRLINKDQWFKYQRAVDDDQGADGRAVPDFVFMSSYGAATSFGVTPSPDKAYTVLFEYYSYPSELSVYTDTVRIPARFNYVILNGGLKHFNMFKDNTEQAGFWTGEFEKGVSQMRQYLAPKKDDIVDTRVNFGGPNWKSAYFGGNRW